MDKEKMNEETKIIRLLIYAFILILIASCIFSNAIGRANQRAEMENFDVYRIHTNFRETQHFKYCPYCGKELKNADSD